MSEPQPIRPAATVMIVRDAEPSFEIFMLRRTSNAVFAGGMYVFPGGRVDADDHEDKYDLWRVGPSDEQAAQRSALGTEWRGYWVAAIRESFEEAGLLLAYQKDGRLLSYDDADTYARFESYRGPLHDGEISLQEICQREDVKLAVDRIHFYNRFITPAGRPRRFDARFFIAEAPPGQAGLHDGEETVDSVWISPQQALAQNDRKELGLMGVTRRQLEGLAALDSKASVLQAAAARRSFSVTRPKLPSE